MFGNSEVLIFGHDTMSACSPPVTVTPGVSVSGGGVRAGGGLSRTGTGRDTLTSYTQTVVVETNTQIAWLKVSTGAVQSAVPSGGNEMVPVAPPSTLTAEAVYVLMTRAVVSTVRLPRLRNSAHVGFASCLHSAGRTV